MFKLSILLLAVSSFLTPIKWQPNFDKALLLAKQEKKLIVLNFSGSDWCGPCIKMRKTIFEDAVFQKIADSTLLLVNADFPRSKKNMPTKAQIKINENLAAKYNPDGKFPYTLLINGEGKVIKKWDGLPKKNVLEFSEDILKEYNNAFKN